MSDDAKYFFDNITITLTVVKSRRGSEGVAETIRVGGLINALSPLESIIMLSIQSDLC
ncbi:MAG: hypothetical protein H6Q52_1032 [Deltaproteobacteria bacterium]|nr:hypothetical protein [Deltaproteobacteria bacterium]